MTDDSPDGGQTVQPGAKAPLAHLVVLGAVCALVIGVFVWSAQIRVFEVSANGAAGDYYNLLVQGLRSGKLSLTRAVPPELARISVPDAPAGDDSMRQPWHDLDWVQQQGLHDLSCYRGRLYLYFGATPALLLFWPFLTLTGHYLIHKHAVLILFSVGFLAGARLLCAVRRRCFPEVGVWPLVAGVLALGLADFIPAVLVNAAVSEVAISCGYAMVMMTLWLLWQAMHAARGRVGWLAGASLAYGLALGARPSLLLGAVILLVTAVFESQRAEGRAQNPSFLILPSSLTVWLAAIGPISLIGLGLMLYNDLRFDQPLEFGQRYQLPVSWHQQFSPAFFWFNLHVSFWEPARWQAHFPFVQGILPPPLPKDYFVVENAFGVLTSLPMVWLALAVPLAWRGRLGQERSALRGFAAVLLLLFAACALPLLLHDSMCLRYELEFASPLVWLAILGIFGLERVLPGWPAWRRAIRCVWGTLLVISIAFNLFTRFAFYSQNCCYLGANALQKGKPDEAIAHFREALRTQPEYPDAHIGLGNAFLTSGQVDNAIVEFQKTLRINPAHAEARNNLGNAYLAKGEVTEAIAQFRKAVDLQPGLATGYINLGNALLGLGQVEEAVGALRTALQLKPDHAWGRYNLGTALLRQGQMEEAMAHLQRAVEFEPELVEAHINLGNLLFLQGRGPEAVAHLEQALALRPEHAEGHNNLGCVLQRLEMEARAITHYEKALALRPDYVEARNNLARVLATSGDERVRDGKRAVEQAEQANRLSGGKHAGVLDTLAAAYAEAGRLAEAVRTAQTAIALARAAGKAEQSRQIQERLQLYQAGRPYREKSSPGV